MSRVVCPWDLITSFIIDAFKGYGVPEEDAKICADVLLESPATMPPRRQGRAASALQTPTRLLSAYRLTRTLTLLGGIMDESFSRMLETLRADGASVRLLSDEEVSYWENETGYKTIQKKYIAGHNDIGSVLDGIKRIMNE